MYRMLRSRNERMKDEVVRFTQELVRTPSLTLSEGRAAELVEQTMRDIGYDKVFTDEAGNVVGVMFGRRSEPVVLLNSHLDTIAPDQDQPWDGSPFSGEIKENRLHGLGASDCKGGLAAQIYAGALLKRSMLPLRGNLVVAATTAEGNGRSVGVRNLMKHTLHELGLKPTYALLGEPTNLGLYYGHDGWMEIDVTVEGSNPFHVDDAARAIYADYEQYSANDPSDCISIEPLRFHDDSGSRCATLPLARRLREAEEVSEVLGQIKHNATLVAQASGSVAVDVLVRQESQRLYTGRSTTVRHITQAWSTDPFHPLMERARHALAAAGCEVRPGKWQLNRLGMGTAGSVLFNDFQIPVAGYGPGAEEQAHCTNEFIDLDKLSEAVYGTAAIAHSLIGTPVFGWTSDES